MDLLNFFERAKQAFLALPALVQWVMITLGKSLLASVVISFLATYATAIFAARHGFRVPIEGVPFLHLAIAFATFITFAGTIILFSLLMVLFGQVKRQIDTYFDYLRMATKPLPESLGRLILTKTRSIVRMVLSSSMMLILPALFLVACILIFLTPGGVMDYVPNIVLSKLRQPLDLALILAALSITFVAIWCAENQLSWIAAQIFASAIIIAVMAFGLFANDAYGSFLRIVRYGGGIAATVKYVEGDNKAPMMVNGNLLILTTTHAVLFDADKKQVLEIALKNVSTIEYGVSPKWQLPDYALTRQRDFIDFDVSKIRSAE
jgi:hypothetical protein